jgi:3-oxoacyl-[acyl-carrier-protein] synthase III
LFLRPPGPKHQVGERNIASSGAASSPGSHTTRASICSPTHSRARRILNAGVSTSDIDFVLGHSMVPDYLATPNSSAVHKRLELRSNCFVSNIDVACNSFMLQLTYAKALVESGTCRSTGCSFSRPRGHAW